MERDCPRSLSLFGGSNLILLARRNHAEVRRLAYRAWPSRDAELLRAPGLPRSAYRAAGKLGSAFGS